jgi:hypothetical protein
MKSETQFSNLDKEFWANIRLISQEVGYTQKKSKKSKRDSSIKVPNLSEIIQCFEELNLSWKRISKDGTHPTEFGNTILSYFGELYT